MRACRLSLAIACAAVSVPVFCHVKTKRMRGDLKLDALTAAGIDRLRPMWLALHHHHQSVAPHLGPFVSDDESWANRKRQYE
jgi:hypothetical protein